MKHLNWAKEEETCPHVSPGGYVWRAYDDTGFYFGAVYNDGWSSVDGLPINHGSIHLAALRVEREVQRRQKRAAWRSSLGSQAGWAFVAFDSKLWGMFFFSLCMAVVAYRALRRL